MIQRVFNLKIKNWLRLLTINLHIRSVNNGLFVYSPRFKLVVLKYRKEKDKTQRISFKVVLYSVLNGLNHEDSAIKC